MQRVKRKLLFLSLKKFIEEEQEDEEIDWDKGIDISEDTEWDDSDVELTESDEA